ncbi:MAG: DEAD/DEAH box helicase [Candidatus Moranbacteria bacterium]|jgi:superfamily II DNA/RNA helicase|nr:DEAD/DEAH box helicase [Candidatus Moranbacteria bacterium]
MFSRNPRGASSRRTTSVNRFGRPTHGRKKRPAERELDFTQFVKKAILTTEVEVYNPKHRFADFEIHSKLKANVAAKGYVHPTPIQDGVIPHILEGRDVIGIANTGTGKTAAFLLPLIHKTFKHKTEKVLIIVPTRELALQIEDELRVFSRGSGLNSALCIGGAHIAEQLRSLARNPSFVIGTPGRLKDLIERKKLDLSGFGNIVLDEVDRMLDMGFINDIKYLVALMQSPRQSLFFSATMPREIAELAKKFLNDPVTIAIKSRATSENVDQDIVHVAPREDKLEVLHNLLLKPEFQKVLIFGRTKHGVDKLAHRLEDRGFKADSIHGDKSQSQRQRALRRFSQDEISILVATDVAARGLDIPDVTHVINYELPENYEDYIHRIGRTGRGNKKGNALTFIN